MDMQFNSVLAGGSYLSLTLSGPAPGTGIFYNGGCAHECSLEKKTKPSAKP